MLGNLMKTKENSGTFCSTLHACPETRKDNWIAIRKRKCQEEAEAEEEEKVSNYSVSVKRNSIKYNSNCFERETFPR